MSHIPRPPKGSTLDLARRAQRKVTQQPASSSGVSFHNNPHEKIIQHTDYGTTTSQNLPSKYGIAIQTPGPRPAKRQKHDLPEPRILEPLGDVTPGRNQGASVIMRAFDSHLGVLLKAMLEHERPQDPTRKCGCGATARFQCSMCGNKLFSCQQCILQAHRHLPFHWINEWNGKFFARRDLGELGLVLTMEHDEGICPHFPPTSKAKEFTVVDISGIHTISLYYCHCASRPTEIQQLMRACYFPATVEDSSRISTVFSFAVMEDFHIQSLTSKKSAYDYYEGLRRHTNNADQSLVPDRYRSLMHVSRVWRHLTSLKRSGQAHQIDEILTHRVRGSTAVRCVACPEDGFNLPPAWQSMPTNLRHISTKFLSADGNHGIQKKFKRDDPDDFALGNGRAYFPQEEEFQAYLRKASEAQEKSTCANLRAVNMQNKAKFRNVEITGVVAIVCARHGLFQPGGVVDLQKGERYANVDYAMSQALRECRTLHRLAVTYDVACQWNINLIKRFEKYFPDSVEIAKRIAVYVAKMHAQGHKEDCRYRYSLNYSDGVGRTSGELIETVWHEHNQAGGSTKEMNWGHRHDTLDDLFGDWNWSKVQQMSSSLYRSLTNARAMYASSKKAFDTLNASPEQVSEWSQMSIEPVFKQGEWHSVFRTATTKAPTQAGVYHKLCRDELQEGLPRSEAQFLNTGLRLQAEQRRLQEQILATAQSPSTNDNSNIGKARGKLRRDIDTWRKYQLSHFPALCHIISEETYQNPELEKLCLPSDFPLPGRRRELGLDILANKETQLRQGEANDALEKVRTTIKQFGINVTCKMKEIRGQRDNTRAQKILQSNVAERNKHVRKYRMAREALIRLGMPEDDPIYRVLKDDDLWMKNIQTAHELGDGTREEPWIWQMTPSNGNSVREREAWENEVDRVRWFRARANYTRWHEEVAILEEEFRRTFRSFTRMSDVWTQLAVKHEQAESGIGFREYAYKKAAMYAKLAKECKRRSTDAGVIS